MTLLAIRREIHIVLHHHDGVFARQLFQQFSGAFHLLMRHSCHRFIDKQQFRALHQQHANFQPLLLAVRQHTRLAMTLSNQTNQQQRCFKMIAIFTQTVLLTRSAKRLYSPPLAGSRFSASTRKRFQTRLVWNLTTTCFSYRRFIESSN